MSFSSIQSDVVRMMGFQARFLILLSFRIFLVLNREGAKDAKWSGVGPQEAFELTSESLKNSFILGLKTRFLAAKRGL